MTGNDIPLGRRLAAEVIGTGALVAVVVGSGIQAAELTQDGGVALLANSLATVLGLGVLIAVFGPVSGAHFNPLVSLAAWWTGRRDGQGPPLREVAAYAAAQVGGAVGGSVLADAMFARPLVTWSAHPRYAGHLWLAEVVATAGLIVVIFGLARTGHARFAPAAVAAYIGAAYWFTSSTGFANPAVTVGRAFTDTYAGIAPASIGPFIVAQLLGAVAGLVLVDVVFGSSPASPAPHDTTDTRRSSPRDAASPALAEQGSSRP
ncbi:glycerol uptake transporter protein [Sphaerisporangium rufum]|uniref:Glycerol uptake transporter protein n=1 Tax=Sphaerisporangium rufum TaxID=1381558 RepID=A0A919R9D2_9ACTN|nr:aquaporin [Sphaerisporangium rufum]GII79730.1 glycerol uptake transporter protein [Sphaerisporangium rufum]